MNGQPRGAEPETDWQMLARHKDIQYASRAKSHIMRQQQIPRLRHIIRDLSAYMPDQTRDDPAVRALLSDGCATIMHVVPLLAPPVEGEDHTKNIDFTPAGMRTRWQAGHTDTSRVLKRACWRDAADAIDAVMVHEGQ